ncbi:MAG: NYN domain-containing protein [Thermoanaerobaculia bacterium]
MQHRYAIALDGGFVRKKLRDCLGRAVTPADIFTFCQELQRIPRLDGWDLLRIYFYDAPPHQGKAKNPIDRKTIDFSTTPQYRDGTALLSAIEKHDDFAVRRGTTALQGWRLHGRVLGTLRKSPRALVAEDVVPNIKQKGVDLRLGLDIATISIKRIVDAIVLAVGDRDFVPVMKMARKEGVRVYLVAFDDDFIDDLRIHSDHVIEAWKTCPLLTPRATAGVPPIVPVASAIKP